MNGEAQTVTTTESNLIDPQSALPVEMFCHSISLLSPTGIAISSRVSRTWRASNLADPTLYSVIDLSYPRWLAWRFRDAKEGQSDDEKLEEEMELYLSHFERLSSLAANKVKKVSFNLACFFDDFEDADFYEDARLDELLIILKRSSATLEEVSISLEFDDMLKDIESQRPPPFGCLFFLQTIIQHLNDHYPNLRKIELRAPTCIRLEAGANQTGSKKFSLSDDHNLGYFNEASFPNAEIVSSVTKLATEFTGTGLTEFWLNTDEQVMESQWYDGILSELWNSRSTLQHLILDESALNTRKAWELVMSCRHLVTRDCGSFVCQPGIELEVEAGEEISLQELAEMNSFKNVSIRSRSGWKSMVKWIGNGIGLEGLALSGGGISEEEEQEVFEDISSSGLSLGSILFNSRNTLVHLDLLYNDLGHLSFLPSTLPFPNLRFLRLQDCSLQLWSAISKLQSLQLRSLCAWLSNGSRFSENHRAQQQAKAFDCLISILKGNPPLTSVGIHFYGILPASQLQEHIELHHSTPKLSFKLESLEISCLAASEWFSQHHYPNLKKLKVNEEHRSNFKNIPF